ncbi:MAG TPA: TIGR03667 family PPOX class F420-dependent oxidoreductase [Thermomonospora sp.]|nr:TIGR03667 family PPOX class F420-dependent oxidoreductase [Thermomonospora sp.]
MEIPEVFRKRLTDAEVIWLTTVGADGTPQPNPVWFHWEGESVLTFSRADARRLDHIRQRPRVSLHLNSTHTGGEVTVLTGTAAVIDGSPMDFPDYVAKYRPEMERLRGSVEDFAKEYSVPMRIFLSGVRGF